MQRRIRPALLKENAYGTSYPAPVKRTLDMSYLNGGLNLWELDYRLAVNQSPDLLNVWWENGALSSRQGQSYVYQALSEDDPYGNFYACYDREWGANDMVVAHKGKKLYKINPKTGVHTAIYTGLHEIAGGTFFVFDKNLYYMNGYEYVKIDENYTASDVEGYIPTTMINRKPDGTGGTSFEHENRLAAGKIIEFTSDGVATQYQLPSGYLPLDEKAVEITQVYPAPTITYTEQQDVYYLPDTGEVDIVYSSMEETTIGEVTYPAGNYSWNGTGYTAVTTPPTYIFSVDRGNGLINFYKYNTGTHVYDDYAPADASIFPSNVHVTVYKDNEQAREILLNCRCATVFGGETLVSVVFGGPTNQPNAYFWSGYNTRNGLDPTYFPIEYYNYAGPSANEAIVGFGKQQNMLVIFKEHSIGKASFETVSNSDGTTDLNLPYRNINDRIGCDIEKSICLIQNNLFFANKDSGVYVLLDSTAYGENTVKRLSKNVNGDEKIGKGLLKDLRAVEASKITSFNDGQRYWITANGHAYLMDYIVKGIGAHEENLCWFYFDNIKPMCWFKIQTETNGVTEIMNCYGLFNGSISKFTRSYNDYGAAINRRYVFATQYFGTYEVLKDVLKVVFAVRSDTDSAMNIKYKTDYEERADLTPIRAYGYRIVPRDLHHRSLQVLPFALTAIRIPRCFHIKHFRMELTNNTINTDMSLVSAQIIYRYVREDR